LLLPRGGRLRARGPRHAVRQPRREALRGHDHRRERGGGEDLEVNPLKSKQLTNFRASGKDEGIRLTPPRKMTLEQAIAYIQDDELVEVTPQSIRLRKRYLDPHERKKASRKEG
jgi:GTP-binding protein